MFDKNAVLTQAQSGSVPPGWQVLRANRSYFYQSALGWLVLAILAIAAAVYLLASGTVIGYGINDSTANNVLAFWQIADFVVLLILLIAGVVFAIQRLRALGSVEQQMLVLTPEGFVMRKGSADKDTRQVSFSAVRAMKPSVSNGTVSLLVQPTNSAKAIKFELDRRFGKPKEIAQQIAGMYAHYATARVQGS